MSKKRRPKRNQYVRPISKCPTKKARSRTEIEAKIKLANTVRFIEANNRQDRKKPKRVYYCSLCGGWHLTSRDFKKKEEQELAS